jgi:hypothetical protein
MMDAFEIGKGEAPTHFPDHRGSCADRYNRRRVE